jgi:hypothetical protein
MPPSLPLYQQLQSDVIARVGIMLSGEAEDKVRFVLPTGVLRLRCARRESALRVPPEQPSDDGP